MAKMPSESVPHFETPEAEIAFLREQIAVREAEVEKSGKTANRDEIAKEKIIEYRDAVVAESPLSVLKTQEEVAGIVLNLSPETHDARMSEYLALLQERGVAAALSAVENAHSPHLEDDFHRFLVQYLKSGLPAAGIREKTPLWKDLHATLYEVSLPAEKESEEKKTFEELVAKMEQFYLGMFSISPDQSDRYSFSVEITSANGSDEIIFYVSVPDGKKSLFEKQILSIFPKAKLDEKADDFNIFAEGGVTLGAYAELAENPIFPLQTYEGFDHDPLNVILNSFSKIDRDGEGAALQFVFRPTNDFYIKRYKKALDEIMKGESVKEAINKPDSVGGHLLSLAKGIGKEIVHEKKEDKKDKPVDQIAVDHIKKKLETPIYEVVIRALVSASDRPGAEGIMTDLKSSFHQFETATGNGVRWKDIKEKQIGKFAEEFSFRHFDDGEKIPLSIREVTTMLHFPERIESPELRQAKAGNAPAPLGLPTKGTLLGINRARGTATNVYMAKEDRVRHLYTIGQTGTGKTTLLKNMIAQDILAGEGVCFIDPHGSDIQDILGSIPKERYDDVIYFDPSYTDRPMALNMLEYDVKKPEQKIFVVNELLSIFKKLYSSVPESMGPAFEQYFRNATMLVLEDPESGMTLNEISRVLVNKPFRELKLAKCKNPLVLQFWKEMAEKTTGDAGLANMAPYITNKFDVFLSNDVMRPIISQEKSSFNFREVMDNKKILLVNLSKGKLGDINANLIGLILVGKILMAALSRVDSIGKDLPPFYLYIDEFQNITTDSIAQILSEARKYKLSLNVAHQFIAQLEDNIKDAVFGNVGSIAAFRVGAEDAEYLEKQFAPVFTARDLMNVDNRNAYVKLLSNGKPVKPFNIETLPPPPRDERIVDRLKELSYLTFGRDRALIEDEINRKYAPIKPAIPPPPPPPPVVTGEPV